ncbi:MAG: ATP-binding protein [bacterium]|nr:ATP-binding protein [bacterium]
MKIISRDDYLSRLEAVRGLPDIKILTGIRRAGKSKLLEETAKRIRRENQKANVIVIDLTLLKNEKLKDYHALHDWIKVHAKKGVLNYVMIDEVQMCKGFELVINSLHSESRSRYDVYLTGSNAFLLSSDLTTLFTGRHFELTTYPFSFKEFCRYFPREKDRQSAFDRYVLEGGLSGSYLYKDDSARTEYLKEIYRTIIRRDIALRYNLSDTTVIERLAEFLMDNVGNVTNANNLSEVLVHNKVATNHVTIGKYLGYLTDAYLFSEAKRYDVRGKKYLEQSGKFYLMDVALRYAVLGRRNMDYGHVYENLVYLELLRRGYDVYVGKLYKKEIDFVAMKASEKVYIQVSDDISNEKTLSRELEPLLQIKDAYPKFIIARTKHAETDRDGVRIVDLADWLVEA